MLSEQVTPEIEVPQPGIPELRPYPMPREEHVPTPTVPWRVDAARAVLLIHDMQRFFLRPFVAGESPLTELLDNTTSLYAWCEAHRVPICYTAQRGSMSPSERGLLLDFWGPGMQGTTDDREIVPELAAPSGSWMLVKWRYSAFHRTDLLERMREAGRDQLIICGVYAHVGILMTACDAMSWDIQAFIAADAVADFDSGSHQLALQYASERCAAVQLTNGILADLDGSVRPASTGMGGAS